jgi:hypothetical protein
VYRGQQLNRLRSKRPASGADSEVGLLYRLPQEVERVDSQAAEAAVEGHLCLALAAEGEEEEASRVLLGRNRDSGWMQGAGVIDA